MNHRWGIRRPVALPALVSRPYSGPAVALVTDLSLDGACVSTVGTAFYLHQFVTLIFPRGVVQPTAALVLPAVVVRSTGERAGLMFSRSNSAARSALAAWVLAREQFAPAASRRSPPRLG